MFEKFRRWVRFNLLYLGRPPWDTRVSPPELKTFLASEDPGRGLDVGCGTGTNLLTLSKNGWEAVGVDIAWLSVLRARIKLRKAGQTARVIHGDITGNLNFSEPFDFILDIGCYHSLAPGSRDNYHENIRAWLKPGGVFLIYTHRRTAPDSTHGITSRDLEKFQGFMNLIWQKDSPEKRPDGGGGRPSTWARFERREEK